MATGIKPADTDMVEFVRVALVNLDNDAELQSLVAPFGIDTAFRAAGVSALTDTQAKIATEQDTDGAQLAATALVVTLKDEVTKHYTGLSELARAVFRGQTGKLTQLGIVGRAPTKVADLLERGNKLFTTVQNHEELAAGFLKVGQTSEKLSVIEARFGVLAAAAAEQERAKGASQQATAESRAAINALRVWWGNLKRIARVALRGKKQLLEKLGITAR
ncbi:hypothetical protein [Armatimonas sp.]|uniref:hypothetical protein n=1 Tax=Armatimonas sp. TaxID=1872638 RepID=UPI00286AB6B5|nr:hypothetical protein [Armatimonas sp.]